MILSIIRRRTLFYTLCLASLFAVALLGMSGLPTPAAADELPSFQEGLWELHRTINDSTTTSQLCIDPTDVMNEQKAALERALCRVTPIAKQGDTYSYTAECSMDGPIESRTTTTLTAKGDSTYQLQTDGILNRQPIKERLTAKRLGPCKQ